jgi:hypothetical protein
MGNACPPSTLITWTLVAPSGMTTNGSAPASPYFYLPIAPLQYAEPGTYTLILKGNCGGTDCPPCIMTFTIDCPNPCPCDVLQFQKDVAKGFAISQSITSCKACFAPIALNDCDMVEWKINGGTTVGATSGKQTFCYNFSGAGTYTMTMIVTRKKSDGSLCEVFVFSRSITINCLIKPACEGPVFPNSAFSQGAVAGGINTSGASEGWYGPCGDPLVVEGALGSLDGWSIHLSGNLDSADVLAPVDAVCLEKSSGTISLRSREHHGDPHEYQNGKHIRIRLYQTSDFEMDECEAATCYDLATIDLAVLDTDWVDITIPYDLTDWAVTDTSCGGVKVRLAVFVTTPLGSEQGTQLETRASMEVDNLCVEGSLVGVKALPYRHSLRISPNPNQGTFRVELPEEAATGTLFRITDLTGRLVQEQATARGSKQQTVEAGHLPDGLYFLQVVVEGQVFAVEKFVKQ